MSEAEALSRVADGTQAAIYAYGLIAARLVGEEKSQALGAMATHRLERDVLRGKVITLRGVPDPAAAAYTAPFPVTDAASARALAALVEDRLAGQWAGLAAAETGNARNSAALHAQECAVRSVTWSGIAPVWSGAS